MRRIVAAAAAVGLMGILSGQSLLNGSAQTAPSWSQFHSNITRDGVLAVNGPTGHSALTSFTLQSTVTDSPVIASNGMGYIADDAGNVYALDPNKGGTPRWTVKPGGTVPGSPALSADGTQLFVASADGNVYDLNTSDGSTKWKAPVGSAATASPLVSTDGALVYVTTVGGALYALNTSNGSPKWNFSPQEGAAATGPVASPDGTVIYFGVSQRFLYGVPAVSGATSSSLATTFYLGGTPSTTPAVDQNGNIVVPEQEGTMELFAPTGGAPRWTYTVPGYQPISTTPTFAGGLVIVAGATGYVYGVSEANGVQTWQTKIGPSVVSSPALASSNNRIYIGSNDGGLYALDLQGRILTGWPDQRSRGPVIASPALGPDGAVWYAPRLNMVYRVGDLAAPSTPPAPPTGTTTPVATSTPTATATPAATATLTPSPTATLPPVKVPLKFSLKKSVKDGSTQVIRIKSASNIVVRIRVNYPNGDHQSHRVLTNSSGKATYSYKQGASKITHKNQIAKVIVKAGTGADQSTRTKKYKIQFGPIDASAEPRSQSVGKKIKFFIHARSGTRVTLYLLAPSGKVVRFRGGRTGPKGFATFTYTVQSGLTKGSRRTVKVLASFRYNSRIAAVTTFKVK